MVDPLRTSSNALQALQQRRLAQQIQKQQQSVQVAQPQLTQTQTEPPKEYYEERGKQQLAQVDNLIQNQLNKINELKSRLQTARSARASESLQRALTIAEEKLTGYQNVRGMASSGKYNYASLVGYARGGALARYEKYKNPQVVTITGPPPETNQQPKSKLQKFMDIFKPKSNPLTEAIEKRKQDVTTETSRYESYGYSPQQAKALAEESIAEGGVTFTPEYAEKIIKTLPPKTPPRGELQPTSFNEQFSRFQEGLWKGLGRQTPTELLRKAIGSENKPYEPLTLGEVAYNVVTAPGKAIGVVGLGAGKVIETSLGERGYRGFATIEGGTGSPTPEFGTISGEIPEKRYVFTPEQVGELSSTGTQLGLYALAPNLLVAPGLVAEGSTTLLDKEASIEQKSLATLELAGGLYLIATSPTVKKAINNLARNIDKSNLGVSFELNKKGTAGGAGKAKKSKTKTKLKQVKKPKKTFEDLVNKIKSTNNKEVKSWREEQILKILNDKSLTIAEKKQTILLLDATILQAKTGFPIIQDGAIDITELDKALRTVAVKPKEVSVDIGKSVVQQKQYEALTDITPKTSPLIVGGEGGSKAESVYTGKQFLVPLGTEEKVLQSQRDFLGIRQLPVLRSMVEQDQIALQDRVLIQAPRLAVSNILVSKQVSKQRSDLAQIPAVSSLLKSKTIQRQRLQQSSRITPRLTQKRPPRKRKRRPPFPIKLPMPTPEDLGRTIRTRRRPRRRRETFFAITKRRGREKIIGVGRTPEEAEIIGKKRVLRTLAATLKVRSSKGRQIRLAPSRRFRTSKIDPLAIVQRKRSLGGRLATKGERLEIIKSRGNSLSII